MRSLADCIDEAVEAGEMDETLAATAKRHFQRLERQYQDQMAPPAAQQAAAARTIQAMEWELRERRRQRALQALAVNRVTGILRRFRNLRGEADEGTALITIFDRGERARWSNVEARRKHILSQLHGRMEQVLATHHRNVIGQTRNKAQLANLVREAFGQNTGDAAAREMADAWKQANEYIRLRFNAAGGHIGKLEDYGLPQNHHTLKVRKASFEEWHDFVRDLLDESKMVSQRNGTLLEGEDLTDALREVYETIVNDGWNKIEPGGQPGGAKLANRHADHRFLHFQSADAWMAYQERFGNANPFDTMMAHLDVMARDTALLEILGPNPSATVRHAEQFALKQAAARDAAGGGRDHTTRAQGQLRLAERLYDVFTGGFNAPINGFWANALAGTRQILQSAMLGGAFLSAIGDLNFQRIAAAHAGLPQWRTVRRAVSLFNPTNKADQRLATRLGLVAEGWSALAAAQARYVGDLSGPEVTRRIADSVMRLSWLSSWTQAGRWAFGMEFMGAMAEFAPLRFDQLHPDFAKTLQRYGIDADDWDSIRQTPLYEDSGATFLRPMDIETAHHLAPDAARRLANLVGEMIQTETEFAVPSSTLRGRVLLLGEARPGTVGGELLRSAAMFKNFAVTLVYTHGLRAITQETLRGKASYAAGLMITMTLMGGLSLQLKELAKGRDPRPMLNEDGMPSFKFAMAAGLQGGGMGIFGDFFFSDLNRFGRGLAQQTAGPVVQLADDIRQLSFGNLVQLAQGEDTDFGAEAVRFARRYMPVASLWQTRLATERLIFDQIANAVDPQAEKRYRRNIRRWEREFGQEYFWRPGETAPRRVPNLENALEALP